MVFLTHSRETAMGLKSYVPPCSRLITPYEGRWIELPLTTPLLLFPLSQYNQFEAVLALITNLSYNEDTDHTLLVEI